MSVDDVLARLDDVLSGVRVTQFVSVGALGAVLDQTVTVGLAAGVGVHRTLAKLVGAELAIVVMFLVNEHWTFADAADGGLRATAWRLCKSNAVRAAGVAVATVVFTLVSGLPNPILVYDLPNPTPLGAFELWLLAANGLGILVGLGVNYVLESAVTWRLLDADRE
jgi:putative flippase GtrA